MKRLKSQAGFTILELLIATMVFSVVLLLVTYGIIKIGNRFYKATLQTQTQTAVRNSVDEITRSIQLSGPGQVLNPATSASGWRGAYCSNGVKYVFKQHQIQDTNTPHILIAMPDTDACAVPANDNLFTTSALPAGARDMLANRMRISNFSVTNPNGGVFRVSLHVVTGEDDLLCSPSANDCNSNSQSTALTNADVQCKTGAGSQYCAMSELTTAVTRRLTQ